MPGEVDDDFADALEFQQAFLNTFIDAAAALSNEKLINGPAAVGHGNEDVSDAVANA